MKRTTYAGLVDEKYIGQKVQLAGWVQKRRNFGELVFIDLRDREGIVQLTFSNKEEAALEVAQSVRNEYVIAVEGEVVARAEGQHNDKIKSGGVEVKVTKAEVLADSKTPVFDIKDDVEAGEELKLQYRYLDLRRPVMQKNLKVRSKIMSSAYRFMEEHDFINIETPYLAKSTPEGARDYLVPSRIYPGSFYALPQSPQLFKQLLMGAGFDRYFQIARCFRDEDLRGDRQPEFTQLDLETSFMSAPEIQELVGHWVQHIMKDVKNYDLKLEDIDRLTWQESMDRFGTDKPDLRIPYEIKNLSDVVKDSDFGVFANAVKDGGVVKALAVPGAAESYSRKDIDKLGQYIERFGAKGLAWMKVSDEGLTGPIAKFFDDAKAKEVMEAAGAKVGDLLLFGAGRADVVAASLDYLRRQTAKEMNLIDQETPWRFAWIVDWPLFEYSEDFDRWIAAHHPFTMPNEEDLHYLNEGEDPHKAHAQSYDLVLNGYELGSGSIRIHRMDIQEKMLRALEFTPEQAQEAFGFLLEAMEYGFPPMGGIALGLDRLAMLLAGQDNIREVIAFPKNSKATEPMTEAPTPVDAKQLAELGLESDANDSAE
ncbi:aspartate--tRNA ligase [Fructobacillus sp. M2-14]|uniref:Aspartate--tRNA(Asp/Asn) ligase n=1 Tax=Fructobacillus broussonetiae TaxID=2713173 RepID=A0ABS5QY10_9LACO|nr:aspartate--tRNA ligase [Fructobacillus broussonetiae]MBS9338088.1 aspartate--tRNA ligase [Fructobacillus broussonetiae]